MPTVLYTYDPLDRLIQTAGIRRFYNRSRMTTEIEGVVQRSVFQVGDHVLAQSGAGGSNLLATDLQRSVLHTVNPDKTQPMVYNVYGHRPADSGLASVLGFNGERADPVTGHYLLGNGYRAFNPVLMRFNSPDSWSPFGKGGFNAYAYCRGEPVNRIDPSGHMFGASKLLKALGLVDTVPLPARPFSQTHQLKAVAGNPDLVEVVERSGLIALEGKKDVFITRTITQAEQMVGHPLRLNEQGHFVRADPIIPPSPSPAPHKTPVTDQPKVSNLLSASAHSLSQPSTNQLRQRSNPTPAIRTKIREP